jgi:ribonuclease T2
MPPDEIVSLFTRANPALTADSVAVSCGHNFLTAIEVCLDKSLRPISCGPIRSCRANTVRIPPPR